MAAFVITLLFITIVLVSIEQQVRTAQRQKPVQTEQTAVLVDTTDKPEHELKQKALAEVSVRAFD
jgi:hypothetical protein